MKEQQYLIPPDLGQAFMLMGMTLPEIAFTIISAFIALGATLHGVIYLWLAPVTSVMLFIRMADNINLLMILTTRINYFISTQHYSLNPRR